MQESNEKLMHQTREQDLIGLGVVMGALTMKKMVFSEMFNIITPIFESFQIETTGKKIATITDDSFEIDINNMEKGKKYLMNYEGSIYQIMRNQTNELELFEIG